MRNMNLNKTPIEHILLECMLNLEWIEDYVVYDTEVPYIQVDGEWTSITNFFRLGKINVTRND